MTIFSPADRHFLVHASAPALAPLAPHLLSLTHPLTVVLFPLSSNAKAVRANTKQIARQSTITFLMADFSPLIMLRSRSHKHLHRRFRRSTSRTISQRKRIGVTHLQTRMEELSRGQEDYFFAEWVMGAEFDGAGGTYTYSPGRRSE